jgi:hypothetical protein
MTDRAVPVEVFTATHRISGGMYPGPLGLFAYLNRPMESSVEIDQAQVHALHQTVEQAELHPALWMVKSEIAIVAVGSRGEVGSTGGARGGYTKPFPHRVRILLCGYEIQCLIESAGKLDFGAAVLEGDRLFAAAYDAHLQAVLFPRVTVDTGGLLFNRKMVQAMSAAQRS